MTHWIHGASIYQIYPRSFKDSAEKGTGDLKGIIEKLDYIKKLNVDGIWLSPFFKSPMHDFGYDISDYCSVDPLFGDLDDFKQLMKSCRDLDLKVIIDMVLNHTSIEHSWFLESRHSKDNDKADWYVWQDARPDGTPPNNWLSVFGGSAWTWEARRGQYYLHNFLKEQPDLNLRNPKVQDALLAEVKFWTDLGVDGIRLDACNFYYHDLEFRNNPSKKLGEKTHKGVHHRNPYSMQEHIYNKSNPENIEFLKKLREFTDKQPNQPALIAEVFGENNQKLVEDYIEPKGPLHTAYSFECIGDEFSVDLLKKEILAYSEEQNPTWTFGNHDVPRLFDRWEDYSNDENFIRQIYAFMVCVRGSLFLYQGDELGLEQADIPFEKIQDPYGKEFFPEFKGRDGCRTPMPWTDTFPHGEFTQSDEPWLPIPNGHILKSVNIQNIEKSSLLNQIRALLFLRKESETLRSGKLNLEDSPENTLIFSRIGKKESYLCFFNFSGSEFDIEAVGHALPVSFNFNYQNNKLTVLNGGFVILKQECN